MPKVGKLINSISKIMAKDTRGKQANFKRTGENLRCLSLSLFFFLELESPKREPRVPSFPVSPLKCPFWGLLGAGKMPKPSGSQH